MSTKVMRVLPMSAAMLLPLAVFADSGGSGDSGPLWQSILLSALPVVVFIALLYFVFIRQIRAARPRQAEYQARQEQHWERTEALLERLVVALERQDKKP
ncbi:MAG TPA: hypothetical protein VLZ30_09895 [Verrucomicrobiae bacterium]|nr:hypothetical protein [Verrucomicrobiae bacterium]